MPHLNTESVYHRGKRGFRNNLQINSTAKTMILSVGLVCALINVSISL